ncbi:tetratricopeptide repeat protein [Flavobacteriaceae bacterium 3-367]|uniref:tetratricopeptide repeat protein n=1 Tax=Eudoraea algarum TaxID=3417568 RepID=UPI00327EA3E2
MKTKCIFLLLLLIGIPLLAQQPMAQGFRLLESGQFSAAETFFGSYLELEPDSKTAKICYGRALGLNGETEKATLLFAKLLETYPKDLEIQLNYNESLLWDQDYEKAQPLYKSLVAEHPQSFAAILGYANTLSNLKEYKAALDWANRALALEPGNKNALISRKYIRLGLANAQIALQDYESAQKLLENIFTDFPEDKETLLNLASLHLITKRIDHAKRTYARYATSPKDSIVAINGMALAEHLGGKEKEALKLASEAIKRIQTLDDDELHERTRERYVQALIWNRKFGKARTQIDSLSVAHADKPWVLALNATLGMYTGDFKLSLRKYGALLLQNPISFDGLLGKANTLFALDQTQKAYEAVEDVLLAYPGQKDALAFKEKLKAQQRPSMEEQGSYSFDNGNNVAYASTTRLRLPLSAKWKTTLSYQHRSTENTMTLDRAQSHQLVAGLEYQLMPLVHVKTIAGLNHAHFATQTYTQPMLDARLQLRPYKLQNLELGYQREVQQFNAALIEREIAMQHYGLSYNVGTPFDLGWYTQLMHTEQSDANTRELLFTSLYYTVLHKQALKFGINYQYISFATQVPDIYFSPESYHAGEVFAEASGRFSKKTRYSAKIAGGIQKVEASPNTPIFRAEVSFGHQLSKRFRGEFYGRYSNIASATATGFEYTEVGLKLQLVLPHPIVKN